MGGVGSWPDTSAPEQIEYLFSNAGARVVVTEPAFLPQVRAAIQRGGVAVERIVLVDGTEEGTISLPELEDRTPAGFHAVILAEGGDVLVEPFGAGADGLPRNPLFAVSA